MRRSAVFRVLLPVLALGALLSALRLAPPTRIQSTTTRERPAFAFVKSPAPPAPAPSAPADTVFSLADAAGRPHAFVVALDELYFPARPPRERLASIPARADLADLLAHAATLPGAAPRLVLYPASGPRDSATRRIVNPGVEVALASADAPAPAPHLGVVAWEQPAHAPGHAIARIAGDPAQPLRAAAALAALPGIVSARPLLARQWSRKRVPDDPLFKDQWHLRNTGQQGGKSGVDIRAVPAWDSASGAGVTIGIVDDGLDFLHPDLSPAYASSLGYDWNGRDDVPRAEGSGEEADDHGTAVAGLAAARGFNGLGLAGAAPFATLAGLRLIAAPTDDSEDAEAMAWRNDAIWVKNNSWGPQDDMPTLFPPGTLWRGAVAQAVTEGRDGLGTLFVWSAGNGQAEGDQGSKDGYASLRQVIPVGAATHKGAPASFSEGGPHLVVTAPGDAGIGLATTDRLGDAGYNSTHEGYPGDYRTEVDYTRVFVGTSASAPVVSGVCALLLELRPDLGWRDVKEIFLRSSAKLQSTSRDWTTRPAGDVLHPIKHHPRHGGGLVNALAALALARDWTPLAPETSVTADPLLAFPYTIPDVGRGAFSRSFSFAGQPVLRVEHVSLRLNIAHSFRGDLEIKLTSPSGVVSLFAAATARDAGADYPDYTFNSVRHWGEPSVAAPGKWTLSIQDFARGDVGLLYDAALVLYGTPLSAPELITPPEPQSLATGSTLRLASVFSGGNLSYQWSRDGKPIKGATSATYRLENFSAKSAGSYTCVATNILGSATAGPVVVTRDDSPRRTLSLLASQSASTPPDPAPAQAVWSATGLPAGLVIDPLTGTLAGRSHVLGTRRVVITSITPDGVRALTPVQLTILPLPAAVVGNYAGIVGYEHKHAPGLHGHLTLAVSANGSCTGGWNNLGKIISFKGSLQNPEQSAATLAITLPPRDAGGGLTVPGKQITLRLPMDGSPATGTPTEFLVAPPPEPAPPSLDAPVVLRRVLFSAQNPALAHAGAYTFTLTDDSAQTATRAKGHEPGTLTISRDGRVKWWLHPTGETKAVTGSSVITEDLHIPLFVTRPKSTGPLLADGWFRLPTDADASLAGDISLRTDRPARIAGGRYLPPTAALRLLGTNNNAPGLAVTLDSTRLFSGEPATLPLPVSVTAKNALLVGTPNPLRFSAAFAPKTGVVTGRFTLADPDPAKPGRVVAYSAVVLVGENQIQGSFVVPPLDPRFEAAGDGAVRFVPLPPAP